MGLIDFIHRLAGKSSPSLPQAFSREELLKYLKLNKRIQAINQGHNGLVVSGIKSGNKTGIISAKLSTAYGLTQIGRKQTNQDAMTLWIGARGDLLLGVADGVSEYGSADVASALTMLEMVERIKRGAAFDPDLVRSLQGKIVAINDAQVRVKCLGTTFSSAYVVGNQASIMHVGDSLVFKVKKNGGIELLTYPHSPRAMDNHARFAGELPYSERDTVRILGYKESAIRFFVGSRLPGEIPLIKIDLEPGDKLFLMTDGVYSPFLVPEDFIGMIKDAVDAGGDDQAVIAERIVRAVIKLPRARDNITLIVYCHKGDIAETSTSSPHGIKCLPLRI
ncbi:MAG: PP2C family protein-serine/threonine phosphatase [Candidatus Margulisiibacteriota bacterium]